jgi:hypothetical protein
MKGSAFKRLLAGLKGDLHFVPGSVLSLSSEGQVIEQKLPELSLSGTFSGESLSRLRKVLTAKVTVAGEETLIVGNHRFPLAQDTGESWTPHLETVAKLREQKLCQPVDLEWAKPVMKRSDDTRENLNVVAFIDGFAYGTEGYTLHRKLARLQGCGDAYIPFDALRSLPKIEEVQFWAPKRQESEASTGVLQACGRRVYFSLYEYTYPEVARITKRAEGERFRCNVDDALKAAFEEAWQLNEEYFVTFAAHAAIFESGSWSLEVPLEGFFRGLKFKLGGGLKLDLSSIRRIEATTNKQPLRFLGRGGELAIMMPMMQGEGEK